MDFVHARRHDERKVIMLNDHFQPVEDDDKLLPEFSNFLGTIARLYVPLNWVTWHHVPDKNDLWEFVKQKYIIPEQGKHWVMKSISSSWRVYKARIKEKHYICYDNDEERLKHRPNDIPLDEFKMLLKYWNDPKVKTLAKKNAISRKKIKDTHTTGPRSFAQIRKKLPDHATPTKAEIFVATRKRKEGRQYKLPNEILKYRLSTIEEICSIGANTESVDQLICGDSSHGSTWLVGRRGVPKKLKKQSATEVPNSYVEELTTKIRDQLANDMKQQMRDNMTWMINKLGEANPNLKVDVDEMFGGISCENENATPSKCGDDEVDEIEE
ncbi:uncharacterized protein [Euphorbia lathyris]|uniref:uncharacterized protein n=1 Tax=Euphorbia lathyris TaxID=212925 RepID=UPI0033132296